MLLRGGVPTEDRTETVIFRSFYEKGFTLPMGAFFRRLLFFYGLEVTHLTPNSIAQIAIFIHLCEAYQGIAVYFNLWRALYHLKEYTLSDLGQQDFSWAWNILE